MKKSLGLFFFGIFAVAIGIGCFSATTNHHEINRTEAKDEISYVNFDDNGIVKLGSYPQDVRSDLSANEIKNNGSLKQTPYGSKYYIYNNAKYVIIDTAVVDTEYSSGKKLSNGANVDEYNGQNDIVIEFKDIEWQLLKEGDDNTVYLVSTRILDREIYNVATCVPFYQSSLSTYLNDSFKFMAFSTDDYKYIKFGNDGTDKVEVTIPTKDEVDLDKYEDKNLKQASDFAILKNLSSHIAQNHGIGVPYLNAAYWLDKLSDDGERVQVCWAKVAYSSCLIDDPKIGIRPVIRVNYKDGSSGGGSTEPATPTQSGAAPASGNVTLGLGIAFTIIGAGGLIAFFVIWAKKHPTGKPPIWIIISIAGCLVISISGLGCLAGGINGGGGGCLKTGYYVQVGQYSGNGVVQVGYTAWLIRSDGTASYCSHLKDNVNASDFSPDNYMTGTYTTSGSKLIIDIPEHYIQNFGTVGGISTYTIKGCETFQKGVDTYRWVRGE